MTIEGKGLATMQSLAAGEKVLSIDMDGSHIYDTVCFFGHQDPDSWSCFCSLSIQSESGHVHQLLLSPTHFLPIGTDLIANAYKYAKDVHIGDIAWVVIAEDLKAVTARGVVIGKNSMTAQGLYNPFTRVSAVSDHCCHWHELIVVHHHVQLQASYQVLQQRPCRPAGKRMSWHTLACLCECTHTGR